MKISTPASKTLPIDQIVPYWRNPRSIPESAVNAVARSIERFGYVQPILVDKDNVVVVGHTRLAALKELGYTSVRVYVSKLSEEKNKEYRLIDNRTSEMTAWDHDKLVLELREFDDELKTEFFPDIDLEIGMIDSAVGVDEVDITDAAKQVTRVAEADPSTMQTTGVRCPQCFHVFQVRTKSLPGLTHADLDEITQAASGE